MFYLKGIKVFDIEYLLLNPTVLSNAGKYTYDLSEEFQKYLINKIKYLDPIEGIWDLQVSTNNKYAFYYKIFGQTYFETKNKNNYNVIVLYSKYYNKYLVYNLYGIWLGYYFDRTATNRIYFLNNDITKIRSRTILNNDYIAKVEDFSSGESFSLNGKNESVIKNTQIDLTKLYPSDDVLLEESESNIFTGTGFFITENVLATNFHVIENAKSIVLIIMEGTEKKTYNAEVIIKDEKNDLAIIKIIDNKYIPKKVPYIINNGLLEIGSSVFTLGFPQTNILGEQIKFTDGKISSTAGIQNDISNYQISVPIQPGNSGGPLFDLNGNVVGITTSKPKSYLNLENVGYAVKSIYLKNLIDLLPSTEVANTNTISNQSITEKIKLLSEFVVIVKVTH